MHESSKAMLKAMLCDTLLSSSERQALTQFSETGLITFMRLDGPLMLNSKGSAELLGVSDDSFGKMKARAAAIGLKELCGQEVTPKNYMFSRISLARFSAGDFSLDWSDHGRLKAPIIPLETPHNFKMGRVE